MCSSATPAFSDRFRRWFASRGWAPREHQLALLAKARDDRSALLIAPTGGGKTLAGFLPSLASAHSVWIEELPGGQLCVRFAQWGDDYEKSPGHLDSFAAVSGWAFDGEGKSVLFDVEKKPECFGLRTK